MQNLINELEQPSFNEAGEVIPVSMVKRRAANVIKQLAEVANQDRNERIKMQQMYEQHLNNDDMLHLAIARIQVLEEQLKPIDFTAYNEAMNKDRE